MCWILAATEVVELTCLSWILLILERQQSLCCQPLYMKNLKWCSLWHSRRLLAKSYLHGSSFSCSIGVFCNTRNTAPCVHYLDIIIQFVNHCLSNTPTPVYSSTHSFIQCPLAFLHPVVYSFIYSFIHSSVYWFDYFRLFFINLSFHIQYFKHSFGSPTVCHSRMHKFVLRNWHSFVHYPTKKLSHSRIQWYTLGFSFSPPN